MEQPLSFSANIQTIDGVTPDFHFHKIYTVRGVRYHVYVIKDGELYHFSMAQNGSGWKIISAPKPPQWILDIENKIGEILVQSE
jgi:hypothetical protein